MGLNRSRAPILIFLIPCILGFMLFFPVSPLPLYSPITDGTVTEKKEKKEQPLEMNESSVFCDFTSNGLKG